MLTEASVIRPDWPAPTNVRALSTTRAGGVSQGPWHSLNLGLSCGDDSAHVSANRQALRAVLPAEPAWLRQVHGTRVQDVSYGAGTGIEGDAAVSMAPGAVLAILSADCLPVLLCDRRGTRVAAAHAGWRGLAAGVIEQTIAALGEPAEELLAWLGPAIGGAVYEVGGEVRAAFAARRTASAKVVERAFRPSGDRWLLDLEEAARTVLSAAGVERTYGGGFCTFSDPGRFFSHRRDGVTGRMASLIWLDNQENTHG